VYQKALDFMKKDAAQLWPQAVNSGNFKWQLLIAIRYLKGEDRLREQFFRANIDLNECGYVLTMQNRSIYRLAPDQSAFDNLFLSGDWASRILMSDM